MEICSVTLKNFKTHADSHFEFCPGTNAICGENGAGKTTILEAIAWTLFDHSDYTRGELIRTGAKSAQVAVSFISHLDERQYEVRRCTSRGYTLYDLQLNSDLGIHLLEDVQQWMRAHLGVPPQTDLGRLFAETIGIPQGTFTTDFLRRPNDRKKIFDPILKVEEYKQTYTQMRDLETYARAQVSTLSQQLAHYEQQLADWSDLQEQYTTFKSVIATDTTQIADLNRKITQNQQAVEKLTGIAQQVQTLESQSAQLTLHLANKTEALQQLEVAWQGAKAAVELCRAKRPAFQAYEEAQAALKTLSEQRRQQQAIAKQREDLRQTLSSREAQVSQLQGQMATFTELEQAVAQWQALVPDQDRLEQQRQETSHALQQLAPLRMQHQTLQSQLAQRQAQHTRLQTHVAELEQWAAQPDPIPHLEQTQHHLQTKLSQLEAGRGLAVTLQSITGPARKTGDRHRQQVHTAQLQLKPLLTPHPDLRFVQQVLESGVALHGDLLQSLEAVTAELTDPAAAATLQSQLQDAVQALQAAQAQRQQLAVLPLQRQQLHDLTQEMQQLQAEMQECDRQLAQIPTLQTTLQEIETQLQHLQDPKSHLKVLQQQLRQREQLHTRLLQLQQNRDQILQRLTQIDEQWAAFAELDTQFEAQQAQMQTHNADYQQYLRHREQANSFRQIGPQKEQAQAEINQMQEKLQGLKAQLQQVQQCYDPQEFLTLNEQLAQLKQTRDQLQGGLSPKQAQLRDLEKQLKARTEIAQQQERDRSLLGQKQQMLQFIGDARHIFNQSGPRITRYYLAEVSLTADKLFRELLNRDEVTLEWTEDYEIRVKERGYWRSFKSLSGGEQMCAALAVRLALLRVLADIDIAFFDEPTTNMDQQRRQQLAEAISNLKAFRQLIVISHDDTFETVTEHSIRVERQPV